MQWLATDRQEARAPTRAPTTCIQIDTAAIVDNFREVRRMAGARKVIAVVKGDAYGHGAVAVARALSTDGAEFLAAGSVDEAIAIRRAGVTTPLLVLGSLDADAAADIVRHDLIASLDNRAATDALARAGSGPTPVWIKVDCGFGRYGVGLAAAAEFIRAVAARPSLSLQGLYTHLPFSDHLGRAWAAQQTRAFLDLVAPLAREGRRFKVVQATASPGLLSGFRGGDAVAIGHLLYGMNPLADHSGIDADFSRFRPAFQGITTRLVHLSQRLPGDQAAAYLRRCRGPLGVVPIGLAHGYRPVDQQAFMSVRGRKAPVLRVCVESTILGLADAPDAAVGEHVTVVGRDGELAISLRDLAAWQATSALALLMGLGRSFSRCCCGSST